MATVLVAEELPSGYLQERELQAGARPLPEGTTHLLGRAGRCGGLWRGLRPVVVH